MRNLISILGIPGVGKSTQIELLKEYYKQDVIVCSLNTMITNNSHFYNLLSDEEKNYINTFKSQINKHKRRGVLAPFALDKIMLDNALEKSNNNIIFDSFPRGLLQAIYLCEKIPKSINYIVILLSFKENEIEKSFYRQYKRDVDKKGIVEAYNNIDKYKNKINTYFEETKKGLHYLAEKGYEVNIVECNVDIYNINYNIRRVIGNIMIS